MRSATRRISSLLQHFVANKQHVRVRQQIEFARPQPAQPHNRESAGRAGNGQGGLDGRVGGGGVVAQRFEDLAQLEQIARAGEEHAPPVMLSQDAHGLGAIDFFLGQVGKHRIGCDVSRFADLRRTIRRRPKLGALQSAPAAKLPPDDAPECR